MGNEPVAPLVEMTEDEFRAALETLKLTQREARFLFLCHERTTRRWASGVEAIPKPVASLLRTMIRFDLNPDDVMASIRGMLKRRELQGYKGHEEE